MHIYKYTIIFLPISHLKKKVWSVSKAQPVKLIYAYGTTDDIGYHQSRRGTKEVNLLNYRARAASNTSDYFSVTMEKV